MKDWGGAREGAGRKQNIRIFSDRVRENYGYADKFFSKYLVGQDIKPKRITVEMVTVGFVHGLLWDRESQSWFPANIQDSVRVGAMKLRQEALLVRESKQTVERSTYGPVIGLPPVKKPDGSFPVIALRRN